jgi:hypothetical protein
MTDSTGVPAVDTLVLWGLAAAAIAGGLAVVFRGVRWLFRWGHRIGQLVDDLIGTEERPGVPARPGVLERMVGIEGQVGDVESRLGRVEHELYPNEGSSLADAIRRVDRRTAQLCPDDD